ncbi:MAG: hypothetical protein CW716_00330 [Candidatus Bathyarchaeum sp.]|nr:MAG: hypothetical protein CW716_00330 [Candidatus Bathyarchaeum sp.]
MTSESGSKIKNPLVLLFTIFYAAAGIVQIGYFAIASSTAPPHLPVLGILSLITAFSLFQMYKWTLPLALVMFVTGITFAATTLSNSLALQEFGDAILINLALVVYVIALLIVSLYVFAKRADLS